MRAGRHSIFALIILLSVALDQWTKRWIHTEFHPGESISVIPGLLDLTFIRNSGAAFGFLASAEQWIRTPLFILGPFLAVGAIVLLFRKLPKGELRIPVALSLISGGAIGNLIDRLAYGYVVDFLDFHWRYEAHFPAFNVADSAITAGIATLFADIFLRKEA